MSDNVTQEEEKAVDPKDLEIVFFCKDSGEILDREKIVRCGKKYVYKNKDTGSKNIAFGTRRSVVSFYKLDHETKEDLKKEPVDAEKKGIK